MRIIISAAHTIQEIDSLIQAFKEVAEEIRYFERVAELVVAEEEEKIKPIKKAQKMASTKCNKVLFEIN